nr:retrovirus-related Pol polyprotein from transposon TNT 1-94 [Tanacetum cinerariifolium]
MKMALQGFDPHPLQGRRSFSTFGRTGSSLSTFGRGRAVYVSTSPYTVEDGIGTHNPWKTVLGVTYLLIAAVLEVAGEKADVAGKMKVGDGHALVFVLGATIGTPLGPPESRQERIKELEVELDEKGGELQKCLGSLTFWKSKFLAFAMFVSLVFAMK